MFFMNFEYIKMGPNKNIPDIDVVVAIFCNFGNILFPEPPVVVVVCVVETDDVVAIVVDEDDDDDGR